jgi:L-2,4-diaminobutyrate decarboxylase
MRLEHELQSAFSQRAPYIFHSADGERTWDQGTLSFLCSRRVDAFKLWVALQRYGADGLGEIYDRLCDTTRYMWGALQQRPEFEVMHEPECNILCFRYVGTGSHADDTLDRLNRELRDRYNLSGEGWITGTNLDGRRVLRVTIMNPRTTTADVDDVLGSLATIGSEMIKEFS